MKPEITYDQFAAMDLRVGTVVDATLPEWSEKLVRLEVDLGEELGKRVFFSAVRAWYKAEDFVGRQFVFVVNMKPKKMGEEESQGMMLWLNGEKPVMLTVGGVANGTIIH